MEAGLGTKLPERTIKAHWLEVYYMIIYIYTYTNMAGIEEADDGKSQEYTGN